MVYHGGHLGILTEADELAPVIERFLTAPVPEDADTAKEADAMTDAPRLHDTPDSDFLGFELLLDDEDRKLLERVRAFMTANVEPVINDYWTRAQFPHELVPGLAELGIAGLQFDGPGCPGRSSLLDGMTSMELARVDPSIQTFMGVHGGLAMGSVQLCGSEEQQERWLPAMARMELLGRLRPHRAAGGFGHRRRPRHHRPARRRRVGPRRREEVDRQRVVRRPRGDLGARRRGRPGQGLRRREGPGQRAAPRA